MRKSARKCNKVTRFDYKNCTFMIFSIKNSQICSTRAARYIILVILLILRIGETKCKKYIYFTYESLHFASLSIRKVIIGILSYNFVLISARDDQERAACVA